MLFTFYSPSLLEVRPRAFTFPLCVLELALLLAVYLLCLLGAWGLGALMGDSGWGLVMPVLFSEAGF